MRPGGKGMREGRGRRSHQLYLKEEPGEQQRRNGEGPGGEGSAFARGSTRLTSRYQWLLSSPTQKPGDTR